MSRADASKASWHSDLFHVSVWDGNFHYLSSKMSLGSLVQDYLTLLLICMISTTTPLLLTSSRSSPFLQATRSPFCSPWTPPPPPPPYLNNFVPITWNDWRAWPLECSCMHDDASFNSNAAHGDANMILMLTMKLCWWQLLTLTRFSFFCFVLFFTWSLV